MNITHQSQSSKWKALFSMKVSLLAEGPIRWISLSPLLNIRHGLGLHLLGLSTPYAVPAGRIRKILRHMLSSMGIVVELALVPSLLIVYCARVRARVDVFVGQGPWEVLVGLILRFFGRVSTVVYDDIDYAPGFQPISDFRRNVLVFVEKCGIRRSDMVISVGYHLAALRSQQGAKHVSVIPNGADIVSFASAIALRKSKGPRRPTVIYAGYLGAWSGIDIVLQAASRAVRKIPSLRIILLGHGAPEDIHAVTSLIEDLELDEVVEYRGEAAYRELPAHFADADIGIALFRPIELRRYAFSLKAVEYMAAGLPVITTEGTETADLVVRSASGIAIPFEVDAAAHAMAMMLTDAGEYGRFSDNAVSHSFGYDWKGLMDRYYDSICSRVNGKA